MAKQFNFYANIVIDADHVPELRRGAIAIGDQLLKDGAWCEGATARTEDFDKTHVRLLISISGVRIDDVAIGRAQLVALAEQAIASGGQIHTLGASCCTDDGAHVDENLFDERPDLQTRPADETVPEPVSVQLVNAVEHIDTVTKALDEATAMAARYRDEAASATALARQVASEADVREAEQQKRNDVDLEALRKERDAAVEREAVMRARLLEIQESIPRPSKPDAKE